VIDVDEHSVSTRRPDGTTGRVPARTVVWAAGVVACELAATLARASGTVPDRAGRVAVGADLTIPGHPEVIALGDMVSVHDTAGASVPLPGLASVAMQQGRYAAGSVRARLRGSRSEAFRYVDKGNLATIGRASAVADIRGVEISGALAWVTWVTVHLFYLIGFQNRLLVVTRWAFSFVTRGRGARLITGPSDAAAQDGATRERKNIVAGDATEAPNLEAQVPEDHSENIEIDAGTARSVDPERGAFAPPHHPPLRDPQTNPRGVRHIDETVQDHMPVADRPRYNAAEGRRSRMITQALRRFRGTSNRRVPSSRHDDDSKAG
ncbi:MAG: hypothetical protein ABI427_12640, partial [Solirubrobacteraceae bacterium]